LRRAALIGLIAVGCGGPPDLMPLEVGKVWKYSVSTGFNEYVSEVRVLRESAVAGLDGFTLLGPTGETTLAWKGDTLIGERFSNTRFVPAIPLAVDSTERVRRSWSGEAMGSWGKFKGTGVLNQAPSDAVIGGQKVKVIKSELVIDNPKGKSIRLQTMYQPGAGIASQHQWYGGDLIVRIERVSGS
jgi:hypothetical protein